ncbi:MAG: cytochrome c biogenesis protein CcdA [Paludibacteraceae bacterium]
MKSKLVLFILLLFTLNTFAQIQNPAKWTFEQKSTGATTADIIIKAKIEQGWHLYGMNIPEDGPVPTNITFEKIENAQKVGGIQSKSKLIQSHDENFGMDLSWYINEAIFVQKISFKDPKSVYIKGNVHYMLCNDETCLAPTTQDFAFGKAGTKPVALNADGDKTKLPVGDVQPLTIQNSDSTKSTITSVQPVTPASSEKRWEPLAEKLSRFGSTTEHTSLWWIFLTGFLGGLLALVMPCIWPIIPMTISFFLKRSRDKKRGRRDAVLYGLSIVLIYVALGMLITILFGASALNSLSTNAVFNIFIFVLLVLFAISFFGAFEMALPASWSTKMDAKAESTTGIISILFMAFTLVIVSFSCTGPIIGLVLVDVSTKGLTLAPILAMLGFSLALAIPFAFFAFFPSLLKSLPKSGGWLNKVKVVLAFLELAFALKFLSVADLAYGWRILDREVFLTLWIVIFGLLGIYLLGKIRFPHDGETKHTSVLGTFMAIISLAFAVYMIPGLWGAPLKAVSAFAPPSRTQDFNLYANDVHPKFTDYDLGMAYAASVNKPVVIDFTGHGCVNCRKMEVSVWTDDKVRDILNNDFILISLYVDEKAPLAQPYKVQENGRTTQINTVGDKWSYLQRNKFGANAQPFYVMLNANGQPLNKFYFPFTENPKEFIKWLKIK